MFLVFPGNRWRSGLGSLLGWSLSSDETVLHDGERALPASIGTGDDSGKSFCMMLGHFARNIFTFLKQNQRYFMVQGNILCIVLMVYQQFYPSGKVFYIYWDLLRALGWQTDLRGATNGGISEWKL